MRPEETRESRRGGPEGEDRRHGRHGRRGRHGHGGSQKHLSALLEDRPGAMLLFVGALNCARHRGDQLGELMREGRLALLCPTAADFASGRYLRQIAEAMTELSQERGVKEFVVMYGCQWAVLSTDFDMILQELDGITAVLDDTCHLCGNAQGEEEEDREVMRQ